MRKAPKRGLMNADIVHLVSPSSSQLLSLPNSRHAVFFAHKQSILRYKSVGAKKRINVARKRFIVSTNKGRFLDKQKKTTKRQSRWINLDLNSWSNSFRGYVATIPSHQKKELRCAGDAKHSFMKGSR